MGRKALSDKEMEKTYRYIVNYLILHDYAPADELVTALGISKGRLSRSLQYGRRNFPTKTKIDDLVLGSNGGYFIPENKTQVIAWYMQYKCFANSLLKTIDGVGEYLNEKYPDELAEAEKVIIQSEESEVDPWGVFNTLIQEDNK